jgi:hypothetical protein
VASKALVACTTGASGLLLNHTVDGILQHLDAVTALAAPVNASHVPVTAIAPSVRATAFLNGPSPNTAPRATAGGTTESSTAEPAHGAVARSGSVQAAWEGSTRTAGMEGSVAGTASGVPKAPQRMYRRTLLEGERAAPVPAPNEDGDDMEVAMPYQGLHPSLKVG